MFSFGYRHRLISVVEKKGKKEYLEVSPEPKEKSNNGKSSPRRMNKLKNQFEVIANQGNLQEDGIIWMYPPEWDLVLYPPKFKAPMLHAFDGKGSLN